MAASTLRNVNRAIRLASIPVELVRGDGYHYFVYDNEERGVFETYSVYVPYTSIYTVPRWVEEAEEAYLYITETLNRAVVG